MPTMPKIDSRQKGKTGELEASKVLTELLGVPCRRGQQFSGIGGADVVGVEGVHFEVKRTQKPQILKAYQQAEEDAKGDDIPVVMHRRNNEPWMITLRLDDIVKLSRLPVIRFAPKP